MVFARWRLFRIFRDVTEASLTNPQMRSPFDWRVPSFDTSTLIAN